MTFDPKTVGILKTLASSDACVLMATLCYVIGKDSDFVNIFYKFVRLLPEVTP